MTIKLDPIVVNGSVLTRLSDDSGLIPAENFIY